jgi:integrase
MAQGPARVGVKAGATSSSARTSTFTKQKLDTLERHFQDYKRVISGAIDHSPYESAAVIVDDFMTGLCQGELVALRWRDIDWAAGVLRVRRTYSRGEWGTPKSRRSSRAVPLADRAAAELERHFQRSAYRADEEPRLLPSAHAQPLRRLERRKRFYAAMTAAAMRARCGRSGGITFHSLRHTFGTRMAAVGVPMRTLQEWMGHRDHTTTLIYADFAPDPTGGAAFAERAFGRAEPAVDGAPSPMMETSVTADMRLRASQVRRSPGNDVVRPVDDCAVLKE